MRCACASAAILVVLTATPALADAVKIDDLVVATTMPDAQRDAAIEAATVFYQFWN